MKNWFSLGFSVLSDWTTLVMLWGGPFVVDIAHSFIVFRSPRQNWFPETSTPGSGAGIGTSRRTHPKGPALPEAETDTVWESGLDRRKVPVAHVQMDCELLADLCPAFPQPSALMHTWECYVFYCNRSAPVHTMILGDFLVLRKSEK